MPDPAPLPRTQDPELDEITLTRARRGERDALEALVAHHANLVHRYVGRVLVAAPGDPRIADLAQDTFVRVLRALPGFEPRGPARLSTWILTIATRLVLDEARRVRRARLAVDAVPDEQATVAPVRTSVSRGVRRAIEALSPDQRAAFLLHELHDYTHVEIASILDLELGTVKSRIARARAKLRAALEEER